MNHLSWRMHQGNGVDTTAQREPARTIVCGLIDATILLIECNEMKGSGECCHAQLLFLVGTKCNKTQLKNTTKSGALLHYSLAKERCRHAYLVCCKKRALFLWACLHFGGVFLRKSNRFVRFFCQLPCSCRVARQLL